METTAEFFQRKGAADPARITLGRGLLENLCQAFGREVFMYQSLEIEDKLGFPILLHVYDEGVAAIPEDSADEALEAMIAEYSKLHRLQRACRCSPKARSQTGTLK